MVDTGLHTKRWTRQQAIDYGIEPSEVERCVVYPGQAYSYMIGVSDLVRVRLETPDDWRAVREVNERAFGRPNEADLVDALRQAARPFISLVATENDTIVGHISFSPITIGADPSSAGVGLAPMAVVPERQNRGIGSRLVRSGLEECRRQGHDLIVVLGHPAYYPRFGFVPGSRKGLTCEYPVPDEVFMVLELTPGAVRGRSGLIRYHAAFAKV